MWYKPMLMGQAISTHLLANSPRFLLSHACPIPQLLSQQPQSIGDYQQHAGFIDEQSGYKVNPSCQGCRY